MYTITDYIIIDLNVKLLVYLVIQANLMVVL